MIRFSNFQPLGPFLQKKKNCTIKKRPRRAFGKRPPAPRKTKRENQAGHSSERTVEGQGGSTRPGFTARGLRGQGRSRWAGKPAHRRRALDGMGTAHDEYKRTEEKHATGTINDAFIHPTAQMMANHPATRHKNHIRTPETPETRSKVKRRGGR